jgi:hypothetical protein
MVKENCQTQKDASRKLPSGRWKSPVVLSASFHHCQLPSTTASFLPPLPAFFHHGQLLPPWSAPFHHSQLPSTTGGFHLPLGSFQPVSFHHCQLPSSGRTLTVVEGW